jgi:hypothetical protein
MRVATALLNALIFFHPPTPFELFGVTLKYPDLIVLAWCSTTIMTFLVCMTMQVRQLAIEEPTREPESSPRVLAELVVSSESLLSDGISALAAGEAGGPSRTMARAR